MLERLVTFFAFDFSFTAFALEFQLKDCADTKAFCAKAKKHNISSGTKIFQPVRNPNLLSNVRIKTSFYKMEIMQNLPKCKAEFTKIDNFLTCASDFMLFLSGFQRTINFKVLPRCNAEVSGSF
jgi:hypothetical protein